MKSQLDFAHMLSDSEPQRIWGVGELTSKVKSLLEDNFRQVRVIGEVTNLRQHGSGHVYFSIKDARSQLNCVMFRSRARNKGELLEDGRQLVLKGELTVYEPRGQYQLVVTDIELRGIGELQLAFERLKKKLEAEGLFAPERKRPIPRYPERIGLVTSSSGAAIRDVLHVIERRYRALTIVLAPCSVQGAGASVQIAHSINALNAFAFSGVDVMPDAAAGKAMGQRLDVILITRGGGSLEDLWAFNEEEVARAIFNSRLPVVSAVGHEIDFTISDFVADARAATPSAAAEMLTEGFVSGLNEIIELNARSGRVLERFLSFADERLMRWGDRLKRAHPMKRVQERLQLLDDFESVMGRNIRWTLRDKTRQWNEYVNRFNLVRPSRKIDLSRKELADYHRRISELMRVRASEFRNTVDSLESRLRLLSPFNVLSRGYSITLDEKTGKVVRYADDVAPGRSIITRLKHGGIRSKVEGEIDDDGNSEEY
ncbi:MAG: exodeoxyribonuclease VII large subunit [Verrucomicrobia bacterium]|nr:exodeoxyribonuclease VII large subunit [Verrucomicrobiota bacterium]